jgi:DNA-binding transcriptional MerR regulator
MSIGEVLERLRSEFPDITISKLRYLESEGLVEPERTAAGYRKYTASDLARLKYVLVAQRDHYLPLKVIREQLDALDRGEKPAVPGPGTPVLRVPRALSPAELSDAEPRQRFEGEPKDAPWAAAPGELRMSRGELAEAAGLSEELLKELEGYGLIAARNGYYDDDMLMIARTIVEMTGYGLEPRHLRAFATSAQREVGLFEQVVRPMGQQRGPQAKGRAEETLRELAALSIRLHAALVQTQLRSTFGA